MKIYTAPLHISQVVASFPVVDNVTSIRNVGGHAGPNSYGLQLNTVVFDTNACGHPCRGWVQFIFSNYGPGKTSHLGIQNWLFRAGNSCPNRSWHWSRGGTGLGTCVQNHRAADVPNIPIGELRTMSMVAVASADGDSLYLHVGSRTYGGRTQDDTLTDLSQHWQVAEFDIFGDCCSSQTFFNPGATVTISLQANTGQKTAPVCRHGDSTTAESNNLSFVAPPTVSPQQYPSVVFSESNVAGGDAASGQTLCNALPSQ
ncbi:MAG: hypothetical protein JO199_12060 [Candidatus Eremiobacteraeota bacterium]|nr:hypothetical protein [Candidatus Eremiobacteraeota bacterium]